MEGGDYDVENVLKRNELRRSVETERGKAGPIVDRRICFFSLVQTDPISEEYTRN
jgi:hypothetical protein